MTLLVIILCATIAVSGGFVVGFICGAVRERHLSGNRRPLAPHEVLAQLRGPLPGGRR